MDVPKTALMKSKSSNSASEAKKNTQRNEKVSRSNAEFQPRTTLCMGAQPLMLKKRGVYVEKKLTKISINQSEQSPDVPPNQTLLINPRTMPRPSKKRFLTSVLTILSKSTAGTQCPDDTEGAKKTDKPMNKQKIREDEEDIREEWKNTAPNIPKKKPKYRSKTLNNQSYRDSFTVLQTKKDIVQSSSNNSEYVSAKYDVHVDPETVKWAESLSPLNQEYDGTATAANHSKKVKVIAKDSDPSTIPDVPKSFNKGIYDFFVDMIQTTMNVEGGLKTESHKQEPLPSANQSKVTLQSKESLARKINVQKIEKSKSQAFKVSRKQSSHHAYSVMPDERDEYTNRQMLEHFQPQLNNHYKQPSPTKRMRKVRIDPIQYKKVNPLPKTTSLPLPNKKKTKKSNAKKDFLKLLKEELQMKSNETFEEPENFYEALKVIARNKRRSQEWKSEIPSDPDDHICQFKPRRVLSRKSTGKQSYYYEPRPISRNTGMTSYKKRKVIKEQYDDETDYSHHSIEVTGYDYDVVKKPPKIRKQTPKKTISVLSTPPTPPYDDFWTDYCDSDASPMLVQRQYVFDKLRKLQSRAD